MILQSLIKHRTDSCSIVGCAAVASLVHGYVGTLAG